MSDYANIVIRNKKTIQSYLNNKDLKKYQKEFDDIFKLEPHILEPNVEKALSKDYTVYPENDAPTRHEKPQ